MSELHYEADNPPPGLMTPEQQAKVDGFCEWMTEQGFNGLVVAQTELPDGYAGVTVRFGADPSAQFEASASAMDMLLVNASRQDEDAARMLALHVIARACNAVQTPTTDDDEADEPDPLDRG